MIDRNPLAVLAAIDHLTLGVQGAWASRRIALTIARRRFGAGSHVGRAAIRSLINQGLIFEADVERPQGHLPYGARRAGLFDFEWSVLALTLDGHLALTDERYRLTEAA